MRILLGCTYITAGAYSMRWRGGRGPSYVVRLIWTSLCVGAWFTVFEACGKSKLCILVFSIYMFGPHAKRWWLSSRTHLSGYQRYRCFPSMDPLGPSLLFAWQQERLIWLRRGLLFLLWDDMHDTLWAHTHTCMCTHESLPSSRSG